MSVFTMVVWIVAICVIGDIVKRKVSAKKSNNDNKSNHDEIESLISINQQLNLQVKSLENRVNNLEAIVTDEGYDLKQKISGL